MPDAKDREGQRVPAEPPELAEVDRPFVSVKANLQAIPFPDLRLMYDHWLELRGERPMPARADFDPAEVPLRILPNIMMVDVRYEPLAFTYRVWGTGVADLHGVDLTGASVMQVRPRAFAEMVWRQYVEVAESKAPGLYLHKVPTKDGLLRAHAILRLPFSSDGKVVDIILCVDDYCGRKEELRLVFEEASKAEVEDLTSV